MPSWERLTYELPADQEELLSLALWARGAVGVEVRPPTDRGGGELPIRLVAYFETPSPSELDSDPPGWEGRGIRRVDRADVPSRDWLAEYRAAARPFDVGPRLRLDPRDPSDAAAPSEERIVLRIPARQAFGTGSHESTRLLLEWLQEIDLGGRRVVDIGTGSGILALAAARLGAQGPVAVDVDPVAVFVARETARINGVRLRLVAGGADCLAAAVFDLALLNILPSEWLDDLEAVGRVLTGGGRALLSGASDEDIERLRERLLTVGWRLVEERADGEWHAVEMEIPPAAACREEGE